MHLVGKCAKFYCRQPVPPVFRCHPVVARPFQPLLRHFPEDRKNGRLSPMCHRQKPISGNLEASVWGKLTQEGSGRWWVSTACSGKLWGVGGEAQPGLSRPGAGITLTVDFSEQKRTNIKKKEWKDLRREREEDGSWGGKEHLCCDSGQGWLLQRPILQELVGWLRQAHVHLGQDLQQANFRWEKILYAHLLVSYKNFDVFLHAS